MLKTIQLFDQVSCFCPTKGGGIIYFGSRKVDSYSKNVCRCVTDCNVEVFSHTDADKPTYAVIADMAGNIIALNSSGNIVLLNPDGSHNRVLLNQNDMAVTDEEIGSFHPGTKVIEKQ